MVRCTKLKGVELISGGDYELRTRCGVFGQRPPIEVFFLDVERVESTDYRKN
jgi:hypothetical protein